MTIPSEPNDRTPAPGDHPGELDLEALAGLDHGTTVPDPDAELGGSTLEQLFYKDDFARTVMIGFAGGFGLSTLVILIALELTSLRTAITTSLGAWWFFVPLATAVGFLAWSFMLVRIRRHRHGKLLRKEAFARREDRDRHDDREDPGADAPGPDHDPADPSQEDWL